MATVFHVLGSIRETQFTNQAGRPVYMLEDGGRSRSWCSEAGAIERVTCMPSASGLIRIPSCNLSRLTRRASLCRMVLSLRIGLVVARARCADVRWHAIASRRRELAALGRTRRHQPYRGNRLAAELVG